MKKYFLLLFVLSLLSLNTFSQTRFVAKVDKAILNKIGIATSKTISVDEQWQVFSVTDTSRLVELRRAGIYVEKDRQMKINSIPNDKLFGLQWGLTGNRNLWHGDFSDAWKITEGSKDVKIGIIDTGSPLKDGVWTHPDLDSNRFSSTMSFITEENRTVTDSSGHSTHVAGIIAGIKNNNIGIVGIDQHCQVAIYKVFSKHGSGWTSDIAQAIYRAVHDGCQVLSMSFGGIFYSRLLEDAVFYAQQHGVICAVAAGNQNAEITSYPAFFGKFSTRENYRVGFPNVISVGAIDNFGSVSSYSNYGWFIDIYAPGGNGNYPFADKGNILSTLPTYDSVLGQEDSSWYYKGDSLIVTQRIPAQRTYGYLAGTSMATPFVAGTISLMLAANPNLKVGDLRQIIVRTADVIMTVNGPVAILNPGAAVQAAKNGWVTSVETIQTVVENFELRQNYPNPFNPITTIKFALPKESNVTLKIYDILGREVETLISKIMPAGNHSVDFNAAKLSSGMYVYRIEADNFVQVKKMLLMK